MNESKPRQVLFVCVENSNRSQVAEGFTRLHGGDQVEVYSAGSRPGGSVNPTAVQAMAARGYDMSSHRSKALNEVPPGPYDWVITMGCGDACPSIPARHREDWPLPDLKGMPLEEYVTWGSEIERRVLVLLKRLSARE